MAVTGFRKRYIAFSAKSPAPLSRSEIIGILNSLGRKGGIKLRLTVFEGDRGIVLVSHRDKEKAIRLLNSSINGIELRTIRTSGTIKKAKGFL